jgi:hypothetical protein
LIIKVTDDKKKLLEAAEGLSEAKRKALDEFLTSYHAKGDLIRFKKELPEKRSSFQDIEEELNTNNANLGKY